MTTETHVHCWDIDATAIAGEFPARCKGCGATRTYPVGITERFVPGKDMKAIHRARDRESRLFIRWGDA